VHAQENQNFSVVWGKKWFCATIERYVVIPTLITAHHYIHFQQLKKKGVTCTSFIAPNCSSTSRHVIKKHDRVMVNKELLKQLFFG
jgi:hypothetical protein